MASPGSSPRRPLYSSLPTGDDSIDEEGIEQEPDDRRQSQPPQCLPCARGGLTASPPTTPSRPGVRSSPVRRWAVATLGEQDSPSWRHRVRTSVAETKECCGGFKELVKGAKELGKATTALAAASRAAAKANAKASVRLPMDEGGVVQPLLQRFGATLQEMAVAQETLAQALHEVMVVPLKGFITEEADRCVELERAYERERGEFVEALGKLLRTQIKPTGAGGANGMGGGSSAAVSPLSSAAASAGALRGMGGGGAIGAGGVLVHRARELGRSRRQFEQARLRLAQKVEEVEARRTLEVTESVAAVLQHLEGHHRLCLDVLAGLAPSLARLREAQARARDGLGRGNKQWERKAEMLEMLLPADLAGAWLGRVVLMCAVCCCAEWLGGWGYMEARLSVYWRRSSSIESCHVTTHHPPTNPPTKPQNRTPARPAGGGPPGAHPRRRGLGPWGDHHGSLHPSGQEAGRLGGERLLVPALPPSKPLGRTLRVMAVDARGEQRLGGRRLLAPAVVRAGGIAPLLRAGIGGRPGRALGGC